MNPTQVLILLKINDFEILFLIFFSLIIYNQPLVVEFRYDFSLINLFKKLFYFDLHDSPNSVLTIFAFAQ